MTAREIEHRIKQPSSPTATVTGDFFEHNSTCAYYLETLSKTHPQRVQKIVRGGKNPPRSFHIFEFGYPCPVFNGFRDGTGGWQIEAGTAILRR